MRHLYYITPRNYKEGYYVAANTIDAALDLVAEYAENVSKNLCKVEYINDVLL